MSAGSAMEAEFDTVAGWTEAAVRELGPEYAIPAGCRGSGSPAALSWLGRSLGLTAATRLVDSGAGVGGPAAYAAQEFGLRPILAEPMAAAARAAKNLFGLPVAVATAQELPFRTDWFDAAWSLGVLCTTRDKLPALTELHRVLIPGGRLGLLVFVQVTAELPCQPDGNAFPTEQSLAGLLADAGFQVTAQADADDFDPAPAWWSEHADEVSALVEQRHSTDPRWVTADEQQRCMATLLSGGHLIGRLISAVAS
jgi:SAM-dependent methyltransferase